MLEYRNVASALTTASLASRDFGWLWPQLKKILASASLDSFGFTFTFVVSINVIIVNI